MAATRQFLVAILSLVIFLSCGTSLTVLTQDTIEQYNLTESDLQKRVFYTSGQVIFVRMSGSFDGSRSAASNAAIRGDKPVSPFEEKVALENNSTGRFHHMTDTHIYVQFMIGELTLPFKLSDGLLDAPEIVYDGVQYRHEEGEAKLVFSPPRE
jgi:hypothetical protein